MKITAVLASVALALSAGAAVASDDPAMADIPNWARPYHNSTDVFIDASDSGAVWVVGRSVTRVNADTVRAWTRLEYAQPTNIEGASVSSMTGYYEFDCRGQRSRMLAISAYPRHNLQGTPDSEEGSAEWSFVRPNTIMSSVMNAVCQV